VSTTLQIGISPHYDRAINLSFAFSPLLNIDEVHGCLSSIAEHLVVAQSSPSPTSMPAAPSTEQRELQLVESVEFKILGVANNEGRLHQLLQIYLAPLILKAASEHASVRAKVSGHIP
jgi:hypothetical protein